MVRLWEIDPAPVLETDNPRLLPWALLLKSTDEQVRKIASILARQDDDDAVARFLLLGGVRYHRNALEEMLGGRKMSFAEAILDGSKVLEDIRDEAAAAGRAAGQAAEARKLLLLLLRRHFPELQPLPEIDAISSVQDLESIIEAVLDAHSAESIRAAILRSRETELACGCKIGRRLLDEVRRDTPKMWLSGISTRDSGSIRRNLI